MIMICPKCGGSMEIEIIDEDITVNLCYYCGYSDDDNVEEE